jgi:hypothetical protein
MAATCVDAYTTQRTSPSGSYTSTIGVLVLWWWQWLRLQHHHSTTSDKAPMLAGTCWNACSWQSVVTRNVTRNIGRRQCLICACSKHTHVVLLDGCSKGGHDVGLLGRENQTSKIEDTAWHSAPLLCMLVRLRLIEGAHAANYKQRQH